MKKTGISSLIISVIVILGLSVSCSQKESETIIFRDKDIPAHSYEMAYESGNWEHTDYKNAFEFNGNHRIVIEVEDPSAGITTVLIPWRRSDDNPQEKDIIIIDSQTNRPVEKEVIELNNEYGLLVFEPGGQSSLYYVYYLPHTSTGGYYPKLQYIKPSNQPEVSLLLKNNLTIEHVENLPRAKIISAQSIDDFNSFFPMEIIATATEVADFLQTNPQPYYLFPEYREHPAIMRDYLPVHWVKAGGLVNGISDKAFRGEYYTFQIGVFAQERSLTDIGVSFMDFEGKGNSISREMVTCFNTSGIDLDGKPFTKKIGLDKGEVMALWFGIEVPIDTKPGDYTGRFIIHPSGEESDTIFIKLKVVSGIIPDFGDNNPENLTRLRWLNSSIGTDKSFIVKPFVPVEVSDKKLSIIGRDIELDEFGLPERISSWFTQEMTTLKDEKDEILARPIQFEIIQDDGTPEKWTSSPFLINQSYKSEAKWESLNTSESFIMQLAGSIEYDGMLDYKIKLIAINDINVSDIKVNIPMQKDAAIYMLGLGYKGGKRQEDINWQWDVEKHQEGVWLGSVNRGLQFVLRDNNYERPLNTNFYQAKPLNLPYSWYNDDKGGINISESEEYVKVENYSGSRDIKAGDTLNFNIRFLITPFKLIDTREHFETRFVHKYIPVDSVISLHGTVVNVHHANEINPYINYPFYNSEKQKAYIDEAHNKGIKVKLYNTIRELSYKSYELFALRSLGDEILNDGEGGGHSWLQEHFKSNYHSAWHATAVNDASILNKGNSRWTNYYIEGINWLAKNQKIDGLYLDDIAFSRTTVKRIASVLNEHRESYIIDLHSANQFNNRDGFINSAFLYMEHMPYISRLWFGEYFEYDMNPDYWLTEVSGLPFGLTGEMLEKGGHPYRGLVYGMTTRVYGNYNPGEVWKLFDDFGISNSEMLGYWVDRSPIKTTNPSLKSTIYINDDKVLIVIGSWSDRDENAELAIDWDVLGFDESEAQLFAPEIIGLQDYKALNVNGVIPIEKKMGRILILEKK